MIGALLMTSVPALVLADSRASIAGDSSDAPAGVTVEADSVVTVEDLLHAEGLGHAWFSPDGERVLFTRQRAAIDVVDRSYDDSQIINQRLFVFERRSGRTKEIAPPPAAALSSIDGSPWEPNGRGALMICVIDGAYRLAFWDVASGSVTVLPGRPPTRSLAVAWIDGRVVYPVIAEDERQPFANRPLLDTVTRKWERAWTGAGAEVTVSSVNPLFPATRPREGALVVADTQGRATKIADGEFIAVEPSPDGRLLAAVRLAEAIAHPLSVMGQRGELQIFSVRGGHATLVHAYDDLDAQGAPNYVTGSSAITWSPRSDRLIVGGKQTDEARERARPFEVRLPGCEIRELPGGDVQFVDADVFAAGTLLPMGWLGAAPVAIGARSAQVSATREVQESGSDYGERTGMRFDLFLPTPRGPLNVTAFSKSGTRKFIAQADSDSALVILDGALWSVSSSGRRQVWAPSGGTVLDFALDRHWPTPSPSTAYFRSDIEPDVERLALLVSRDGTSVQRVVLDLKKLRAVAVQDWEPVIASARSLLSTVISSADGWRRSLTARVDGHDRVLVTVNEHMRHKAIAPATKFQYRTGDRDLVGWYLAPPMMPPRPFPAIAVVYGGEMQGERPPMASAVPPVFSGQLLAAQGYVVIYPSLPLESARTSDPMTLLADESIAAVDALATQGTVDPARVGVMGQSLGGWTTAAILAARSDRFRAGVAMAGLYDYAWPYGTPGLVELLTDDGRFKGSTVSGIENGYLRPGPLWKDPRAYERISPIYQADRIDAPLLMLAGDLDIPATSLAGAMRMYNALVRAGKQPVLVRYWGEGHVAQSPAAWRDQWYRVSTWFDHYLKH
jgi:dipeptidyl aminopeptidase/acylaminoacyl peptidase